MDKLNINIIQHEYLLSGYILLITFHGKKFEKLKFEQIIGYDVCLSKPDMNIYKQKVSSHIINIDEVIEIWAFNRNGLINFFGNECNEFYHIIPEHSEPIKLNRWDKLNEVTI